MAVTATDPAGNEARRGFYHYIREKRFRKDTINITDGFLDRKMPEFDLKEKEADFSLSSNPNLEKFIYINQAIRKQNNIDILKPLADTANMCMWEGKFLRLAGSANRAGFADHRVYKYKGKVIDRQYHLGIDLASVSRTAVPAANSGRILYTGNMGIFGNVILIDHGFGVATIYSHLSTIGVKVGDRVKRGDLIGRTGATGLAGGDHLHFGVAVHNIFVDPIEWWDMNWLENNVLSKIKDQKF